MRLIITVWFFATQLCYGQEINKNPFFEIISKQERAELHFATKANLSSDFIHSLRTAKPSGFDLIVPDETGDPVEIEFESYEVLSNDFRLVNDKGREIDYEKPLFFKGKVAGNKGFATMSVFKDKISAVISLKGGGNLHVAQDSESKKSNEYWIYNDQDWKSELLFDCHTEDKLSSIIVSNPPTEKLLVDQCVEAYLEADFFMFQDYGSEQGVMDYLSEVWVHIAALYEAEEITMNISEVFVWTSPDPYSNVDAGAALSSFQNLRENYNGDIAHLVSTNPGNIGGIAFLGALCSSAAYGFSNITNSFSALPNYSWTINVLAHEIGHNLGAYHTHSCNWPQGPIDNCSPTEGNCNPGPTPTNGGTIMSYCHLTGVGIDFNNGFGPVPGDFIRANVAEANCLAICDSSNGNGGAGTPPNADFTFEYIDPCATGVILFENESTGDPTSYFWEFEGGNPIVSTSENPLIQYPFPGVYNVSLTVTNDDGTDTEVMTNVIEIMQEPTINISSTNPSGNTYQFTGNSNNANTWFWDFGDGTASNLQSPTHTFDDNETYVVSASASNECGTTTTETTINISINPEAAFTQNTTVGCAPLIVNYINQSLNNPTDFFWQFQGATPSTSTLPNPQVVYQIPGSFDVRLQVSNEDGFDVELRQNHIRVEPQPVASFTENIDGATVDFTNTSLIFDSALWDFGNGDTSSSSNPSYSYSENGNYTVTLAVTNDCGTDTFQKNISINGFAEAGISSSAREGCAPFTVNFTSTSANATSVSWEFPGGSPSVSSVINPSVSYNQPGLYDVALTVTNGLSTTTEIFENYISVNASPVADFDFSHVGMDYSFENESQFADQFIWDFGDGNSSTQPNPNHTYQSEGTYQVTLTAQGPCGTDISSSSIVIFNFPTVDIIQGEREHCVGEPVDLQANFSSNVSEYFWEVTGPETLTSDEPEPTFYFDTPGLYSVFVEVTNPAGTDSESLLNYFVIGAEPVVDFTYTTNVLTVNFNAQISNASNVIWSFGDGTQSTAFNPTHEFPSNGDYLVTLAAFNDCGTGTSSQMITIDQLASAGFSADKTSFCQGEFVEFENSSTMTNSSYLWSFPGGIPATSTDVNPRIFYNVPGVYDVVLFVENPSTNDELVIENYIQVDAVESFEIENTLVVASDPTNVRFNYNNSIPGDYFWDFGDGTQSFVQSPVHQFPGEGSYDVTMQFVNNCIELDTSFVVQVYNRPRPAFSIDEPVGCVPYTISVKNLSPSNYTDILWTSPGSIEGTSTQENPIFTYLNPGEYDISLKLENPLYEIETIEESVVTIIDVPEASYDYEVNGFTLLFENTSTFGISQSWDFGDGSISNSNNPNHSYQEEGTYLVRFESRNICGVDIVEDQFEFYTMPKANFTTNELQLCSPANVQFENLSSDNSLEYEWFFEGANITSSTQKNPTAIYNERGTFDVSLIVRNPLFSDTIKFENYITVVDVPDVDFTFNQSGMQLSFSNLSEPADSYEWNFGDGNFSTETNPVHEYENTGNYSVQLSAFNDCGVNQLTLALESRPIPAANFSVSQFTACANEEFSFTNLSDSETESYEWLLPGSNIINSTEENPKASYVNPGQYDVTLIAFSDIGIDTLTFENYITVLQEPIASFDYELDGILLQLNNTSIQSTGNIWLTTGQASMEESPNFTFENNAQHVVQLIAQNSCGVDTTFQVVTVNVLPEIDINVPAKACVGETIFFESPSTNVDLYTWYLDGEIFGSTTIPSWGTQLFEPGFHTIGLIGVNDWGQSELEIVDAIEVIGNPVANFDVQFFNDQILLTDLSANGTFFEWDFGDGTVSNSGGDQFHDYELADVYDIRFIVGNECAVDTFTRSVDANILLPEIFFDSNEALCAPTQIEIGNESIGDVTSWFWRLSGPDTLVSFDVEPSFDVVIPGTYDLYVEAVNIFGTVSDFKASYLNLEGVPDAEIEIVETNRSINFSSINSNVVEYFWDFGDGRSSDQKTGNHIYNLAGVYEIIHRVSNICGENSVSDTIDIQFPGQFGEDLVESLEVYPNPTDEDLTIELTAFVDQEFEIHLVNDIGQEVMLIKHPPIGGTKIIPITTKHLPQGTYHLWIKASEHLTNATFVKY